MQRRDLPARLARLEARFSRWRKERVRGERIPKRLWDAAVTLALQYGVSQTAAALKLEYYALKKRLESGNQKPPEKRQSHVALKNCHCPTCVRCETGSATRFVELPSVSPASECVVEFEDGTGATMRMHFKGADLSDVVALGRSFWSVD